MADFDFDVLAIGAGRGRYVAAIRAAQDIAYACHAHPTHSEAIKEAAMAVRGKAIHI